MFRSLATEAGRRPGKESTILEVDPFDIVCKLLRNFRVEAYGEYDARSRSRQHEGPGENITGSTMKGHDSDNFVFSASRLSFFRLLSAANHSNVL
jgi:hypothetical protein